MRISFGFVVCKSYFLRNNVTRITFLRRMAGHFFRLQRKATGVRSFFETFWVKQGGQVKQASGFQVDKLKHQIRYSPSWHERGYPMMNTIEIDGYRAVISYDPDIEMFRGEFVGLNGRADFYAKDAENLKKESAISFKVYLDICAEGTALGPGLTFGHLDICGLIQFTFVHRILRLGLSVGKLPASGALDPTAPLNFSPRYIQLPCHAG